MRRVSLAEVADLTYGYPFPSATYKNAEDGTRLLRGDNVGTGQIRWDGVMYWPETESYDDGYIIRDGDIVLAMDRPVLSSGLKYGIAAASDTSLLVQRVCRIRATSSVDPRYLGAVIGSGEFKKYIESVTTGSAVPHISGIDISRFTWKLLPLDQQVAIGEVLGALDDKIAANRRVVALAGDACAAIVDRAVRNSSSPVTLGEVCEFHNRKRIPLSRSEREARSGEVPYYGATTRMGYVDSPLFDDQLVLVGEDGSVVDECGFPVVQYIWGPAWVNNHAHVLKGKSVSTELLRWLLMRSRVDHLVTGAVQPKLSMGQLKSLKIDVPTGHGLVALEESCSALVARERAAVEENEVLAHARDELLPLLMNGRITVKDAERAAGDVL